MQARNASFEVAVFFVFRANGQAIFLAQPNGLDLIALHTLGLKARPLCRTISRIHPARKNHEAQLRHRAICQG